jgi:hypothetical protein
MALGLGCAARSFKTLSRGRWCVCVGVAAKIAARSFSALYGVPESPEGHLATGDYRVRLFSLSGPFGFVAR